MAMSSQRSLLRGQAPSLTSRESCGAGGREGGTKGAQPQAASSDRLARNSPPGQGSQLDKEG